jgi:hypothetical protein
MSPAEFACWVESVTWWEAVSFRETAPHEWTRPANYGIYRKVDVCIRDHFDSRTLYRYKGLIVAEHQYWTCWPVVNRAPWCGEHHTPRHVCEAAHE